MINEAQDFKTVEARRRSDLVHFVIICAVVALIVLI